MPCLPCQTTNFYRLTNDNLSLWFVDLVFIDRIHGLTLSSKMLHVCTRNGGRLFYNIEDIVNKMIPIWRFAILMQFQFCNLILIQLRNFRVHIFTNLEMNRLKIGSIKLKVS